METTYAYMAGVIDSDGYIGVTVKRNKNGWQDSYQPRVQVKQVQPDAVDLFAETFGGHRYGHKPGSVKGRPLQVWSVHSAAVVPVLEALSPFLRIKSEQARNALAVAAINGEHRRRFAVPPVADGDPLVPLTEVAVRLGMPYESVVQAVHKGSVPFVRTPRAGRNPSVFIPESYIDVWRNRGSSPRRDAGTTAELHALYENAKRLNKVGV